ERDHHQVAGQRCVLGPRIPRSVAERDRGPGQGVRVGRGDAAVRHLEPDGAADHDPGRHSPRRDDPRGSEGPHAHRLGQPGRGRVHRRRHLRHQSGHLVQPELRPGAPLLSRSPPGTAGEPHRARHVLPFDQRLRTPAGCGARALFQRARVRAPADADREAVMSLKYPPLADAADPPALVTGASAEALAAAGHPVVVGARRADRLDDLVRTIREAGGQATAAAVDVTDAGSVAAFVDTVGEAYGEPEVLVSSAGSLVMGRVWELDPEVFASQVDIHLLSVQRLLPAVVPGTIGRGRGAVGLSASHAACTARPRSGAYVAATAGLETMAAQARKELEGTGVRLGVVRPGPVMTEMGTEFDEATAEALIN